MYIAFSAKSCRGFGTFWIAAPFLGVTVINQMFSLVMSYNFWWYRSYWHFLFFCAWAVVPRFRPCFPNQILTSFFSMRLVPRSSLKVRNCGILYLGMPFSASISLYNSPALLTAKSTIWDINLTVHFLVRDREGHTDSIRSAMSTPPMYWL